MGTVEQGMVNGMNGILRILESRIIGEVRASALFCWIVDVDETSESCSTRLRCVG